MEIIEIAFNFKGSRRYIHGTDMFNAMFQSLSGKSLSNIRFMMHGIVDSPCCRLFIAESRDELDSVNDIRVRCQYDRDGVTHWLALSPAECELSKSARYEYDEERLLSHCEMQSDGITLLRQSPFSFIENVVAMNKHMHLQMFPEATGRWMFTRIDLIAGCEARESIALKFRHNMNFRLTKSDILVEGQKKGDLYFSLIPS